MLGLPSLAEAQRQWATWAQALKIDAAAALADHFEQTVPWNSPKRWALSFMMQR